VDSLVQSLLEMFDRETLLQDLLVVRTCTQGLGVVIETGVEAGVGRADKGGKVALRVTDRARLGEEGVGADRVVPVINVLGDGPGLGSFLLFLLDHLLKLCNVVLEAGLAVFLEDTLVDEFLVRYDVRPLDLLVLFK